MSKIRVYTGHRASASAMALTEALRARGHDAKRIRTEGSRYRPRAAHLIVNYGSSSTPDNYEQVSHVLNPAMAVAAAINKIDTFNILLEAGIKVPKFVVPVDGSITPEQADEVSSWGNGALFRTTVTGSGGEGIEYLERVSPALAVHTVEEGAVKLVQQYIRKNGEYRVHVFNGEVIDLQKKRRRGDEEEAQNANPIVRNLENGWVYCRNNVTLDEEYKQMCVDAVHALGLDFGAVDLITTSRHAYVLEINSAPGLQGATLDSYVAAIEKLQRELSVR